MNNTRWHHPFKGVRIGFGRAGVRAFVMLALLFGAAGMCLAQGRRADGWWNAAWKCRRTVQVKWPMQARPGREATAVSFPTGGYMQPNGEDIRVVSDGISIPHQVIFVGPGDRVSLMFPCEPGQSKYHVYYGNPDCPALEVDWTPQRGLIMETRPYQGGNCRSWAEMQNTLQRAGPPYGRALVEHIFHGHNPFGPSRNFVTKYTGWLFVPAAAVTRDVALSSASASFVFLDDKVFLAWPGWHGAVADGRFHKALNARAEPYKLDYYHIQGGAEPIMVLAWKAPDVQRYEPVPHLAFMPPLPSTVGDYLILGQTFAPDFNWRNRVEAECGGRFFVEMGFTDTSFPKQSGAGQPVWDFGDGVTSTMWSPSHFYLATGTYVVTLTYTHDGQELICRQKVVVDRDWANQIEPRTRTLEDIAIKTRSYDLEKLAGSSLFNMLLLQRELGRKRRMLEVAAMAVRRVSDLPPADAAEAAVILSTTYRESSADVPKAVEVLRACEAGIKPQTPRARLAVMLGDIYYYDMNQLANARPEYERVLRDYPESGWHVRMASMRLGDIERELGRFETAQRFYRKALENRTKVSVARELLNMAMRALETEDYLRRGELDAASASLDLWQWQQPEEKLRGQWSVLKVRYAMATKNLAEAIKEAEVLLLVNPESQYAPKMLLLLAETRMQNREDELALAALDRLKAEYPDSPLVTAEETQALRKKLSAGKPR